MNRFSFKNEYYGDDWQESDITAYDSEHFAEKIAKDYWSQDPSDPSDFKFEITVRDKNNTIKKIIVWAELAVNFYSKEINDPHTTIKRTKREG